MIEKKINTSKNLLDFQYKLDYEMMVKYIDVLSQRYKNISVTYIGESQNGKKIPMITIGKGKKSVLYIGAHHGGEWITSVVLIRFINEYCELLKKRRSINNIYLEFLDSDRTFYVVPMLNPDGVDISINGVSEGDTKYNTLLKMNENSFDFSRWQSNAKGVDLNHNYDAGFEKYKIFEEEKHIVSGRYSGYSGKAPVSEPETSALVNFIKFNIEDIKGILTLHSQGEEIYYTSCGNSIPRIKSIGKIISRISGYKLSTPEGASAYGGLTDWFIQEYSKPAFTIECGKGKNPLPLSDYFYIYTCIRTLLFTFPTLL